MVDESPGVLLLALGTRPALHAQETSTLAIHVVDPANAPISGARLEVIGTVMRTRTLEERRPLVRQFAERMLPLFDQRVEHAAPLRPVLERSYPMTALAEAHRALEGNQTFGKVVVTWED